MIEEGSALQSLGDLNEKEARLIQLLRSIGSGEIRIVVQDHLPVRVEELHRYIELR